MIHFNVSTIYESKGLEFNDVRHDNPQVDPYVIEFHLQVLLYNFFEDSTLGTTQWRHLQKQDSDNQNVARFDPTEHVGLCTEVNNECLCNAILTMLTA